MVNARLNGLFAVLRFDDGLRGDARFGPGEAGLSGVPGTQVRLDRWAAIGCSSGPMAPGLAGPANSLSGPIEDDGLVLVADARIDNRSDLGRRLGLSSSRAGELSDGELILLSYRRWGEDCCRWLVGDYAFLIRDDREQRLFCGRDPLGQRSLFYWRSHAETVVTSNLNDLLALCSSPRRLNIPKLADYMLLMGDAESTYYKDIHRVPAAHSMTVTAQTLRCRRYWDVTALPRLSLKSDDDYVEAFREVFAEAVACRLDESAPVGLFLSGGLDSSSVAAEAAEQLAGGGRRLTTYTATPRSDFDATERPGWYYDETPFVNSIAKRWQNIDSRFLPFSDGGSPFNGLDKFFEFAGCPTYTPFNRPWMERTLESARGDGIRVLLGGFLGNLTISYDGSALLPELARAGRWFALSRELRAQASTKGLAPWRLFESSVVFALAPAWMGLRRRIRGEPLARWAGWSPINPALAEELRLNDRMRALGGDFLGRPPSNGRTLRCSWLSSGPIFDSYDIYNAWRAAYGVEVRDPTADQRVIEFCLSIPEGQYLRNGSERYLIRRAMAGKVPDSVLAKNRLGLQSPDWFEGLTAAREEMEGDLDAFERSATCEYCLDLPRMRRLLRDWPSDGWHRPDVVQNYSQLLARGTMVGRFILWAEGGTR